MEMNGAHKKKLPSAWCVGAGPKAFLARQVPTSGRRRMVAKTDAVAGRPAVIFDHSPFGMMVSFYEPRTTSHGFFADSDAAFRRDSLKLTTSLRATLSS